MSEVVWLLGVQPWIALGQVFAGLLGLVGAVAAAGYGVAAWMRADDPDRDEVRR